MKNTKSKIRCGGMLAILVLALGLMVWTASVAEGRQLLTVNGADDSSITLEVGQSCTVEVVSDDSRSYEDYEGFDNGVVLGTFSHVETMPAAGNSATVTKYKGLAFYGYYVQASGVFPPPSPGVHFVFEYVAQQVGETDLKLYQNDPPPSAGQLLDSVHITVIPAPMGTAITYQGRLMDAGKPADGLYDFEFKLYRAPNGGIQEGNTIDINDLDVIDGQFAVELDFGSDPNIFNGYARWLQIGVRPGDFNDPCEYTILEPRVELTPIPYAIYAKTAPPGHSLNAADGSPMNAVYVDDEGHVGIGTTNPQSKLSVGGDGEADTGVYGSGSTFGVYGNGTTGVVGSGSAYGVIGIDSNSGFFGGLGYGDYGVYGSGDYGVYGSGSSVGVSGKDSDTGSYGRLGYDNYGVYGSGSTYGVYGIGSTYGVYGRSSEPGGSGVHGINDGGGYGGYFIGKGYFSGNVGIGTTSPGAKLGVNGQIKITGGSPGADKVLTSDASGLASWQTPAPGGDSDWIISGNDMYSTVSGNVGIGTTTPDDLLNVWRDTSGSLGIRITNADVQGRAYALRVGGSDSAVGAGNFAIYDHNESATRLVVDSTGNVGIGTTSPTEKLEVNGTVKATALRGDDSGSGGVGVAGSGSVYGVRGEGTVYGVYGLGNAGGVYAYCMNDDSGTNYGVEASAGSTGSNDAYGVYSTVYKYGSGNYWSGYFRTKGTGGTNGGLYADWRTGHAIDIAEYILDTKGDTEAGDVLVADPDNDESAIKSSIPYDSTVVGIVSTQPHMLMGMELVMDEDTGERYEDVDAAMLALAGRVPVKVTDENGPIERGDLLTTSSKPGYAMKWTLLDVNHAEDFDELKSMLAENETRRNAVVGKALGNLDSGDGKIVALVNLQ